ncbi:MAG TPA: hypothetical protein VFB59_05400 [Candidatus Saccharimonadales bacterium]|nr:hypothetical protein [Candidatus Saccharimonadales bacterium]
MSTEKLPSVEEFVDDFITFAQPENHFPLTYWQNVARAARQALGEIRSRNNGSGVGGRGFILTGYDAARVYGTVEPELHCPTPHVSFAEDKRVDDFPEPELFDENGCYNV